MSAGGFAIFSGDYSGSGYYAFFNSSGTCVSGSNGTQIVPIYIPAVNFYDSDNTYGVNPAIVEYGGNLNVFYQTWSGTAQGLNQWYVQISTSTYQPVPLLSASVTLATASTAVGSQVASSGTPSAVKYYASATESLPVIVGQTSTFPSSVVANFNCNSFHACTLPNGNFVIAYAQTATPYAIYANVYSPIGGFITSFLVGSGGVNNTGTTSNYYSVRVCALSSGKFVITYPSGNSTTDIISTIYSSSYRVIGSVATTGRSTLSSNQGSFSCIGVFNDNWVLTFCDASDYPTFAIYNSSGTLLQGPTNFTETTGYYHHTPIRS